MLRGITPVDAAFEMMGLHQAQALTHFIFVDAWGGKIIFVLGFLVSFVAGLEKGNFRPVMVFVAMFFIAWFLLVMPRVKPADPVSTMERGGYGQIKSVDILRKNGYAQLSVNPVLDLIVRWMDSLVTGMAAVIGRTGHGRGYLESPFLMVKTSLLLSYVVGNGILDPALETRAVHFYQDHYWSVARARGLTGAWPGDAAVLGCYTEEGRRVWAALRDDLYAMLNHNGIVDRMSDRFYGGKLDGNLVVRDLLARDLALKPQRYSQMAYDVAYRHEGRVGMFSVNAAVMAVFEALPYVHGHALMLMLSGVPFCLALAMVSRRAECLWMWCVAFFSVKAWTLGWAVLDQLSVVWWSAAGGALLWQGSVINAVVAAGAILSSAGITAGMILSGYQLKHGRKQ